MPGRARASGRDPVSVSLPQFGLHLQYVGLGVDQIGPGLFQRGLIDGHRGHIERVVYVRQHTPLLHDRPIVDQFAVGVPAEGKNHPGNLGADVDDLLRLYRAGGADRRQQVAPPHRDGAEHGGPAAALEPVSQQKEDDNQPHQG